MLLVRLLVAFVVWLTCVRVGSVLIVVSVDIVVSDVIVVVAVVVCL